MFRLTNKQLDELTAIQKEDPYTSDQVDIDSSASGEYTFYYLRDVWQKSVDVYGAEVVNAWVCASIYVFGKLT